MFKSIKSVAPKLCTTTLLVLCLLASGPSLARAVTPWYAAGSSHTIVLKQDGTVWALGSNNYGQLGIGSSAWHSDTIELSKVTGLSGVVAVAAGGSHSAALKQDGTVWTWGYNGSGELGNNTTNDSSTPLQVAGLSNVTAIAAGGSHVLALKKDGTVWAWGNNRLGQLGIASQSLVLSPVQVSALEGITAIAAGGYHSIVLKQDGSAWTFGYNGSGQLGNGMSSSNGSSYPVQVAGLSDIQAVAAGINHSVVMGKDRTIWTWGSNSASQMGNGSTSYASTTPTRVNGLNGVQDITAKANQTIALMQDGTVWAWGGNGSDQWGNGNTLDGSSTPVQMRGVSSVITVAAIGRPATLAMQAITAQTGKDPFMADTGNSDGSQPNSASFAIAYAESHQAARY